MTTYRERLVPGMGTYLAFSLLAPASLLVFLPISLPIGIAAAIVITGGAIVALIASSPVVAVQDGRFVAGRAAIDATLTGSPEAFRGSAAVAARGVNLDARAFTLLRGWVDPVVRVPIRDDDDPAPYWVVSTRRPVALIAALDAARVASPH